MADALTVEEMLQAEKSAAQQGWDEARLLETAGRALGRTIHHLHPRPGTAIAYLGKGHNAGDALVALQLLRDEYGWQVGYRAGHALQDCSPLVREHANRLGADAKLEKPPRTHACPRPLLMLDGLLGTGSKGSPRAPLDELVDEMSRMRQQDGALVLAVDLPSGVNADTGEVSEGAVVADQTLMIANAKAGLLRSTCTKHTGALAIVPVDILKREGQSGVEMICPQELNAGKPPRSHDSHKGSVGSVRMLVGSPSYPGAAAIAAIGALRGGAGLVRLHVPESIVETVRCICPPEIIVAGYSAIAEVPSGDADSRVVGCGLGKLDEEAWEALRKWISDSPLPTILDADALNAIAAHKALDLLQSHHVITPHPGEFQRLAPKLGSLEREESARRFAEEWPATLLLKGSRSLIAAQGHSLRCNATGNAGMASGGQGDLLSGVVGARLAFGDSPRNAASLGAWLCGRAAELAIRQQSPESLSATDTSQFLGRAWQDWRQSLR
ncbi:MAG: NAD(P)H-hydrate dehydratase [Akkermansiaceae bacterium]|nr:NAD(P)H-hydrate dehydratase [Akkermansiaceae bacterium]